MPHPHRGSPSFALPAAATILSFVATAAQAALVISSSATSNVTCSGGVCSPTTTRAVLNVDDLENLLASGNVTVNTGTGNVAKQVKSIVVRNSFGWASASTLTLDARVSITFDKPVVDSGTGGLTLITNDGGTGGTLSFGSGGSVSFLGTANALTIDGSAYTLVNSIAALASGIAANAAGNFALANSYNAQNDGTYSTAPIPTEYTGNFQGLGNTISNLTIADSTKHVDVGLFAELGTEGSIQNILLTGMNVGGTGKPQIVGGLVGLNDGYLFGDTADGALSSNSSWGGVLAGENDGTINSSHAAGTIRDTVHEEDDRRGIGGLVGTAGAESLIENSDASVAVNAGTNADAGTCAGGLISVNEGIIENSHASGIVSMKGDYGEVGGLVCDNSGSISASYATGAVSTTPGDTNIGVGGFASGNSGSISNSYSTGAVSGVSEAYAGGFLGADCASCGGTISDSYSTGAITGSTYPGGFVGDNGRAPGQGYTDDYWDTTTSGLSNGTGTGNAAPVTGLTTAQLQAGLPAGFDPAIWAENPAIDNGLPYLIANPPPQ